MKQIPHATQHTHTHAKGHGPLRGNKHQAPQATNGTGGTKATGTWLRHQPAAHRCCSKKQHDDSNDASCTPIREAKLDKTATGDSSGVSCPLRFFLSTANKQSTKNNRSNVQATLHCRGVLRYQTPKPKMRKHKMQRGMTHIHGTDKQCKPTH